MHALLYKSVYLLLVTISTFVVMSSYQGQRIGIGHRRYSSKNALWLLALFVIFFIGLRPVSRVFNDMGAYYTFYNVNLGNQFTWSWYTENYIFDNILPWFAAYKIPVTLYFFFISAIYFGCIAWACMKLFPRDALLAFVVYLGAFSTFASATNGIKAGAAASIFLLALAYKEKKALSIVLLFVTLGFHHSMLAPIAAFVLASIYQKPKAYLWVWIVCFLLAAGHVTFFMSLFAGFTDEHGASYLTTDNNLNVSGFRPDFILYSAIPVFLGYNLMRKGYIVSEKYNFLWCVYTLANCVFLLCTYGDFINRIAYLSWAMYPIVLLYPFVNTKWSNHPKMSKRYLQYAVYGHLGFTLFMQIVYYA